MAVNALIISDLHAHAWPRFSRTLPDGTNSRFSDLLGVLYQVEDHLRKIKPESLIILGDVTHRRFFVQFSIYTPLMARIIELSKLVKRTIIVVGNHDIETRGHHSLGPFAMAGLTVVDEPTWLPEGYFVPYMSEGVADAFREPVIPEGRRLLSTAFTHYVLDGKVLDNEFRVPSSLGLTDLRHFPTTFFGHIHTPSVEHDARAVYVGAPMHFDFGDTGDRQIVHAYHNMGNLHVNHLRMEAPRFITVTYPKVPAVSSGRDFLRILNVPRKQFAEVKELAVKLGWAEALPVEVRIPTEAIKAITSGQLLDSDALRSYVERHYPDLSLEDRQPILDEGLDLLRKAEKRREFP